MPAGFQCSLMEFKGKRAINLIENYLSDVVGSFRSYKRLAERALEQINDEEFFAQIDEESNSIAIIVKHIAGNQRSRWRDFLTSDGEKPDRDRDTEFELIGDTRASLMDHWELGWQTLFHALEILSPEDLERTVMIRGEPHTVVEAINRQLTHYSYHIGQIVFLAKHLKASEWKSLSVPRNSSAAFNRFIAERAGTGGERKRQMDSAMEFGEST
ncbi:DUF1572 family protein [Leptolyngbya sp. 7M]|uniref:DUF1572 family protein n=1 Tax=Leptolyngbya sp. 7M TaxID=2812896 RepID=UPI001B8D89B8|nr:DUF1572 family protein [Leptolyngbya sp. 7M]QYO66726.1 DUF1572 domain-containing protein [Leptolyngbya sp. 7M]